MKTRRMLLPLFVLALTLIMVPAAFAQQTSTQTVSGTGTLTAEGDGRAQMRGSGTVIISGSGLLIIRDTAGDVAIEVSGDGNRRAQGSIVTYRGFNGTATISGSNFSLSLRGTDISLTAAGTGAIRLQGSGTFTIGSVTNDWTDRGVDVRLEG